MYTIQHRLCTTLQIVQFVLEKCNAFWEVKKNMSYIGVEGNSPILTAGPRKGNGRDRPRGGLISDFLRGIFGFFSGALRATWWPAHLDLISPPAN